MGELTALAAAQKLISLLYGIGRIFYRIIVGTILAVIPESWIPHKSVRGDVVLITGAGSGIGREMAVRFSALGARLVLWDLNAEGNAETKRLCEKAGAEDVRCYVVNIADRAAVYETATEVGRVDILINNAGIVTGKKIFDCADEQMEKSMAVNTNALFWTAKAFVPGMISRDHGHIVVIASMAGKVGVAGLADYCASKFGAVGFAESLRAELRCRSPNLHVTLVCPYYIRTGMFEGVKSASPILLPMLDPKYAAERILNSVLTNNVILYMPRFCNVVMFLKEFIPTAAAEAIADLVGSNHEMDEFVGRQSTPPKPVSSQQLNGNAKTNGKLKTNGLSKRAVCA